MVAVAVGINTEKPRFSERVVVVDFEIPR